MDYKNNILKCLTDFKEESRIKEEIFKVKAYDKVIRNIEKLKYPITSYDQIENISGAGKSIKEKIKIMFEQKINVDDLRSQLTKIYGVGPKKASDLIEKHNIKSLSDLKQKTNLLTNAQKIGFICYDDLLERIPRSEMLEHKKLLNIKNNKGEIVGSFRRKEKSSGDIDVMLNMTI